MGDLGIVGVGGMGAQMWHRLRERSRDAVVVDASPAAVQALVAEGATAAVDAADLASGCDTILLSLPTSAECAVPPGAGSPKAAPERSSST
jgi:3-hydroxyisobutyrate dehydrogenase